ncbi:MAG TPA: MBG domain-containing protein, partial [Urbifossiella sp.]
VTLTAVATLPLTGLPPATQTMIDNLLTTGLGVDFVNQDTGKLLGHSPITLVGSTYEAVLTVPNSGGLAFNAGTYSNLTASFLGTPGSLLASTTPTVISQPLKVNPATLTVTVNSHAAATTKLYGDAVPALTYDSGALSVSGLVTVNGDTIDGVLTGSAVANVAASPSSALVASSTPVGTYTINQGGLKVDPNYTLVFTPGTFTINKLPITVTINDVTRAYHADNPTFTFTAPLLFNDPISAIALDINSTGAKNSAVGTYPITAATGGSDLTVSTTSALVVTSPTHEFASTAVGALLQVTGGIGWTPGTYTIVSVSNGAATLDRSPAAAGTVSGIYAESPLAANYDIVKVIPGTLHITPIPTNIVVGPGAGAAPIVQVYSPSGQYLSSIQAFDDSDTGGVRVATADFNSDGVIDYAFGTGPGVTAEVKVIDGATGKVLFDVNPFGDFSGGVFVTTGDVNGDGVDDLVITPDQGGGPRVVVYSGADFSPMVSFYGINDPSFRGGARAAVGDINGDGYGDIVISAGYQGGPRISIWDGKSIANLQFKNLVSDFYVFDPSLRNGAYVAVGDVNGDGFADLIAGAGPGGGPEVKIISGTDLINPSIGPANAVPFANFFAGDPNNRGGVRVATKSLDGDFYADIVTGVGDGGGDIATAYLGADLAHGEYDPIESLDAFPGFMNGVFVG